MIEKRLDLFKCYIHGRRRRQSWSMIKSATRLTTTKAPSNPADMDKKNQECQFSSFPHQEVRLEQLHQRIRELCQDVRVALRSNG